jgi:hypothetical protein
MWYKFRRHLQHVPDQRTAREILRAMFDMMQNQCLTSPGLATNVAAVQSGNSFAVVVNGHTYVYPASTAMAALPATPTVPNSGTPVQGWAFAVQELNGVTSLVVIPSSNGPVAAVGQLAWPAIPDNTVVIGYLILNNGSAGTFTPATTSLATAGLVLNYINTVGPFYPVSLFGAS